MKSTISFGSMARPRAVSIFAIAGRVSTGPGATQNARTPCGAPAFARPTTKLKSPDLAVPYIAPFPSPSKPVTDPMQTMTPLLALTIYGMHAREKYTAPLRFTSRPQSMTLIGCS